jgi:hypothetical protein
MRVRTVHWVILAMALTTLLGSPAQAAEPSQPGNVGGGASADPFDESNAIEPGEAALGESTGISIPGNPGDDLPVVPPKSSGGGVRPLRAVVCDKNESWIKSWSAVSSSNVITHAAGYIIPAGGSGRYTKSTEFQKQLTASVSFNGSVTIGSPIIRTGLEAQVGFDVSASGSKTTTSNTSVETTVTKSGTHIFFMGRRTAKGSFTGSRCNSDGTAIRSASGRMESYAIPYEGAVWCGENPKAGSFEAIAKKYCD